MFRGRGARTIEKDCVLIIGSGIAACTAALQLAKDKRVLLITKGELTDNNTIRAQGGIAAVVDQRDSWELHVQDTIKAGYNLNNEEAVELLVKKGSSYIQKLAQEGFPFDYDANQVLSLGKEGAHSRRRILHAGGDATGKAIITFLHQQISTAIEIITNRTVIELIMEGNRCIGVQVIDEEGVVSNLYADSVVLATGGCGALFDVTSNHPAMLGEGIGLAYQAGAILTDLEFIQFHPTLLWKDNQSFGLISEAVRGEGARLVTGNGDFIMENVHPLLDLAPRDVVARTIQTVRNKGTAVYLDISQIKDFRMRFPSITTLCEEANVNISKGLLPVSPGVHFAMGGVQTDKYGRTSVAGLYAVGEVACTGAHGANRLASNSLLEGLVYGQQVARHISKLPNKQQNNRKVDETSSRDLHCSKISLPEQAEIKKIMTEYAGIQRDYQGLQVAKNWLENFCVHKPIASVPSTQKALFNQLTASWLLVTSALARNESRGSHYRMDFPENRESWENKHIERYKEIDWQQAITGGEL
ncbi:L-aspartate oxidase [Paraliobacillus sediminis]|uniref:L-aspartate oxidase n=1 Tax=Paraliobacillus sediminis TaxID=1885916 RepID=UPI000E3CE505|nr:L-aspartate oxidase [Paraliobacillus sediminis]